ncbi:unnamed protein product [Camellia sinensis]
MISLSGFDNCHVKTWACKKALVKDGHCFEAIELVMPPGEAFYNKFKIGMPTWTFPNSKALVEANDAKLDGNRLFGDGQYEEALVRLFCDLSREKIEDTIKECTKALELNPNYVKALRRRGEAHEKLQHFEEAIADMKKIFELDQSDVQARRTIQRLEPLAAEKRER